MAKKKETMHTGKRVRRARLDSKISLDTLAGETGLSKDRIKKIESGEQIPSVGNLIQISRALGIDSNFLLREQQDDAVEKRSEAYTKRTDNYAYTSLTPGAENKHLKAFRIIVKAEQHHGGVGFQHDGEEFVYVLKGRVEVTVGENAAILKKGETLHFNSSIKHDLRNVGKTDAELIVVVYTP